VKPPRTVFLKWPFGHPLGEPFNVLQQRAVIIEALNALCTIQNPGEIINLPFRWKRSSYDAYRMGESKVPLVECINKDV
jgi:D-proline reductase (dithiol) PrdB